MYRFTLSVLLLVVTIPCLAQPSPAVLEQQLPEASGPRRLEILSALTTAYRDDQPERALVLGSEALEIASSLGDSSSKIEIYNALSAASQHRRDFRQALEYASRARLLAQAEDDRTGLALALRNLGRAHRFANNYDSALEFLSEAKIIYEQLVDDNGLGHVLSNIAVVRWRVGDYSKAIASFLDALERFEKAGNRFRVAGTWNNLGVMYHDIGQHQKSLDYHQLALEFYEQNGHTRQVGGTLSNLGNVYQEQGELRLALGSYERCLAIWQDLGNSRGLHIILHNIGGLYLDFAEPERALGYLERSLEIKQQLGDKQKIAKTLIPIAIAHRQKGQPQTAIKVLQRALGIAAEVDARLETQIIYRELSNTYSEIGSYEKALAAFMDFEARQSEMFNEDNSRAIAEMQARFDLVQKEKEIELLRKQQKISSLELERQKISRRLLSAGLVLTPLIFFVFFSWYQARTRAEREQAVSARLREVDRIKDEFLAKTSHELRTPLYGMIGLTESLLDISPGEISSKVRHDLSMIAASGRRLSGLVNDILDFAKLKNRGLELEIRHVELHALTDVVLTLSTPLVGTKSLDLVNAVPLDLPHAPADENRLQQVLYNLVGNAIKFTDSGTVEVSAEAEGGQLIVHVSDTGIGISPEEKERIFESFEQGEAVSGSESHGTGLGLAISRQLVALHGGRLWLDSSQEEGATFSFTLPLTRPDSGHEVAGPTSSWFPVSREAAGDCDAIADTDNAPNALSDETPKILVVDDEPVVRQVLANHLSGEPYRVLLAANGQTALEMVESEKPDLVLLDVMMPTISGYEVCQRIREQRSLDVLPIIFLSAKVQTSDQLTGFAEGANDYLVKPIAKSELLARVRTHLELLSVHRGRMDEVKVLRGLLPICCQCKKIRDDQGYWKELEVYIGAHSEAVFSHGMCPVCTKEYLKTHNLTWHR